MKTILLFALSSIMSLCITSEKSEIFNFKNKLEYTVTYEKLPNWNHKDIFYINNADNSYWINVHIKDSGKNRIEFMDYKEKSSFQDFSINEIPNLEQNGFSFKTFQIYENYFPEILVNYSYYKLNDTIINEIKLQKFVLKSVDPKRENQKKLARMIFYVDTSKVIKPLLSHSTAYEVNKHQNKLPNGLIYRIETFNYDGTLSHTEQFNSMNTVNFKQIIISK